MKRLIAVCLVALSLAVSLVACGDDKPSGPPTLKDIISGRGGMPGGLQGEMPGAAADAWKQMGNVELTDEMMAGYVKVLEKMKALEGKRPDQKLLAAYGLDWKRWTAIASAMARASMVGAKDTSKVMLEKQLEGARLRYEDASGEMKDAYAKQIAAYEKALAETVPNLPDTTELDRKNQAVLERWMDRIKAATR